MPSTSHGFTKLIVHDLEKMAAFYREVYGLHAVHRVTGESIGGEQIDEIDGLEYIFERQGAP